MAKPAQNFGKDCSFLFIVDGCNNEIIFSSFVKSIGLLYKCI